MTIEPIHIVTAVISNGYGEVLLVRKRGSSVFMQPGGKREQGEKSLETLQREIFEELEVQLNTLTAKRLGEFEDVAVNEPGRVVRAETFAVEIDGVPNPRAEIEEAVWVEADRPFSINVAPLSSTHILPAFVASGFTTTVACSKSSKE